MPLITLLPSLLQTENKTQEHEWTRNFIQVVATSLGIPLTKASPPKLGDDAIPI